MGCYVNPSDCSKEEFLRKYGHDTGNKPCKITETHLPVCLVHNGHFTAAAVCYNESEVKAFSRPDDHRPSLWFKVSRTDLRRVSDLARYET